MTRALTAILACTSLLLVAPRPALAQQTQTKNPHGDLKEPCASCHVANAWKPARITSAFKHSPKVFPLEGAHQTANCRACHASLDFKGVSTKCAVCHKDFHRGELGSDCAVCHSPRSFVDRSRMVQAHQTTRFPLTGAHVLADCLSCHPPVAQGHMSFVGRPLECFACHIAAYNATTSPGPGGHKAAGFPTQCEACHTTVEWQGSGTFDHNTTKFPLTGAHTSVGCASCHNAGVYKGLSTTCVSCHQTAFNNTTTPAHAAAGFPVDCTMCHATANWTGATFDHNKTAFPLVGAHLTVLCASCHGDGVYKGKAMACIACHQTNFDNTANPKHSAASFGNTCLDCHSMNPGWAPASWVHPTNLFQFTGAHIAIAADCKSCHADNVFKGKGTTCITCHLAAYNATTAPAHASAGYSTTCTDCHTTTNWAGATFDHQKTLFPLFGAHTTVTCAQCHGDGVYKGKAITCISCHQAAFNGTANPKHASAGFLATNCTTCHTTNPGWAPATWTHPTNLFQFTGAHVALAADCAQCHADNVFKGKGTTCVTCHLAKYNATSTPVHSSSGFSTTCETCHTTSTWLGAVFDHSKTLFPLTGAHIATACSGCHGDGVYKGKAITCVSCHQTAFNNTANPKHANAGFLATNCSTCHTTNLGWTPPTWTHPTNLFQFTGAHLAIAMLCNSCHADNVFKGKGTTCVTCHLAKYNATTSPVHSSSGFPNTCADCHTTATWLGAVFDHNKTLFPLTGAHMAVACASCHGDGVYKGKPITCVSCHLTNFNNTANPKHANAGFLATNCATCHTTNLGWAPPTWTHPTNLFQFTGYHVTIKDNCVMCHTTQLYKGLGTTCVTCHLAIYNATTNPVHTTAGFPTTCADCHTTTVWTGAVFNHTFFNQKHHGSTCIQCHTIPTNYALFSCRTCHGNTHNKNYTDAQCWSCHPKG